MENVIVQITMVDVQIQQQLWRLELADQLQVQQQVQRQQLLLHLQVPQ